MSELSARKASEVTIGAIEDGPVLDREYCEVGVHHQRPACLSFNDRVGQERPVVAPGNHQLDLGLLQPFADQLTGLAKLEGRVEEAMVGCDANEGQDRLPRQADWLRLRQHFLEPASRRRMLSGAAVVRIQQ